MRWVCSRWLPCFLHLAAHRTGPGCGTGGLRCCGGAAHPTCSMTPAALAPRHTPPGFTLNPPTLSPSSARSHLSLSVALPPASNEPRSRVIVRPRTGVGCLRQPSAGLRLPERSHSFTIAGEQLNHPLSLRSVMNRFTQQVVSGGLAAGL